MHVDVILCIIAARRIEAGRMEQPVAEAPNVSASSPHKDSENGTGLEAPMFDFNIIVAATNNFSDVLGEGGFGPVYRVLAVD